MDTALPLDSSRPGHMAGASYSFKDDTFAIAGDNPRSMINVMLARYGMAMAVAGTAALVVTKDPVGRAIAAIVSAAGLYVAFDAKADEPRSIVSVHGLDCLTMCGAPGRCP